MSLDTNYGASSQEKNYVKSTLEKKGVQELFKNEMNDLSKKIIRNFHNDNYRIFEVNKKFDTEKTSMKNIIDQDATMKAKYEGAKKNKKGFSEGIALLQAIAIKCVDIINDTEKVDQKLTSRNGTNFKSQAIDGILGPNTFYVLASIAKKEGISFDGTVSTKNY